MSFRPSEQRERAEKSRLIDRFLHFGASRLRSKGQTGITGGSSVKMKNMGSAALSTNTGRNIKRSMAKPCSPFFSKLSAAQVKPRLHAALSAAVMRAAASVTARATLMPSLTSQGKTAHCAVLRMPCSSRFAHTCASASECGAII